MIEQPSSPTADRVFIPVDQLREASEAVFRAVGLSGEDAATVADVMITNDLRGIPSHGIFNRIGAYVESYRAGDLDPRPGWTVLRETPTTAVVDGGNGLGLHVAARAMDLAIAKAREYGMGSVGVRNVGHMGGTGYHAMRALPHDMIGIAMSANGPIQVLPTFGAKPRMGTNPLAWAAPAGEMPPFVFDIGTSQVAAGRIRLAQKLGLPVEPGWIAGPDGAPITERVLVPDEFYVLPMGGTRENGSHKGFGMAAVVEIMASMLTGMGASFVTHQPGFSFHLAAYRIDAFIEVAQFKADMDDYLRGLTETPPAPGCDRVVYPGLLAAERQARQLETGIPYPVQLVDWFRQMERDFGLKFAFT